jgi:hemerythrin
VTVKLFDFENEFKLGIDEIDLEHAKLVNMLNDVQSFIKDGKKDEARNFFRETLTAYVVEHFANEEKYMESISFPQIEEHRQIHTNFKQSFVKSLPLIDSYDETAFRNALTDTYTWIINHIGKTDKKYAIYSMENKTA